MTITGTNYMRDLSFAIARDAKIQQVKTDVCIYTDQLDRVMSVSGIHCVAI